MSRDDFVEKCSPEVSWFRFREQRWATKTLRLAMKLLQMRYDVADEEDPKFLQE
jgi:hypothetical protein